MTITTYIEINYRQWRIIPTIPLIWGEPDFIDLDWKFTFRKLTIGFGWLFFYGHLEFEFKTFSN